MAVVTRPFAAEALPHITKLTSLTDLRYPSSWYPLARSMQRTIICHLGPTNSGKTHNALAALASSNSGIYCGPLRLLAWEIATRLNGQGVMCNLITGQEMREIPGAKHVSSTVEMASTSHKVDVAVIDELQLLSDPGRGWAFTRALLGLPANEIHVCGDPSMLPLLERLCAETKEKLVVKFYERLSPLRPAKRAIQSLKEVKHGDCVVAFSRKEVHAMRRRIERDGKHRCAVVYGALPPESRSLQAQLFNTPRNGFGVLSASDAVGMGLNLAIRRIIFTTMTKYDGVQERQLTPIEIKQIAGRAGRFSSAFSEGIVTAMSQQDIPLLHEALATPVDPIHAAAVFPRFEQLAAFASAFPQCNLADILDLFAAHATLDSENYFYAHFDDVKTNAVMLRHLPLSLREAYTFAISPCDPTDGPVAEALVAFATAFSLRSTPVTPELIQHPPLALAQSSEDLRELEATHRAFDLFVWLSYRFEDDFEGRERAEEMRYLCAMYVDESIQEMSCAPRSKRGSRKAATAARLRLSQEVLT